MDTQPQGAATPSTNTIPPTNTKATCPKCKSEIDSTSYFCPHCGNKIKDPPLSTDLAHQIVVYATCIFLPPFGLLPGVRYILQKDPLAKKIGIAAIVLTIIATIVTTVISIQVFDAASKAFNSQLQDYQNIGGF
ncbi:MAG TPA: zinc ribbon domain-containing protein [Patescibacteria group bacterium]|nr:zinc ribbon domain-containing protein [Patescibacteria group bacterium]